MASTLVSLDEYLSTTFHPDREYDDGAIVERNAGTQSHGSLQSLVAAFFVQLLKSYRIRPFIETRLQLNSAPARYRVPDVMVLEHPYTKGRVVVDVPAIIIEILSPEDTLAEVIEHCLEYAALGVPNILVLDPEARRQYRFVHSALELVSTQTLHLPKRGIDLEFPGDTLFAELDD